MLPAGHLVRRLDDGVGELASSLPVSRFTSAAAFLMSASARITRRGRRSPLTGKFCDGALGLRAVERVGGHFDRAQRVGFGAGRRRDSGYSSNSTLSVMS